MQNNNRFACSLVNTVGLNHESLVISVATYANNMTKSWWTVTTLSYTHNNKLSKRLFMAGECGRFGLTLWPF